MPKLNESKTIYIYLAKRDKTGIRLISKFIGSSQLPVRIEDINYLNLSQNLSLQIQQLSYDNRMNWELWIESIDSFNDFRNSLKSRGYQNIPINPQPEISSSLKENQYLNLNRLPKLKKMIRKG